MLAVASSTLRVYTRLYNIHLVLFLTGCVYTNVQFSRHIFYVYVCMYVWIWMYILPIVTFSCRYILQSQSKLQQSDGKLKEVGLILMQPYRVSTLKPASPILLHVNLHITIFIN